jgi:hypothetical protein
MLELQSECSADESRYRLRGGSFTDLYGDNRKPLIQPIFGDALITYTYIPVSYLPGGTLDIIHRRQNACLKQYFDVDIKVAIVRAKAWLQA